MQEHGLKISELVTLFNLEVLNRGSDYDTALLTITDVNRPGLQFHSFYDYFDPRRLQVLGKAEITYLKGLTTEQRRKCFDDLFLYDIPALVISRGLDCFPECLESARVHERTLLRTEETTVEFTSHTIEYLNRVPTPSASPGTAPAVESTSAARSARSAAKVSAPRKSRGRRAAARSAAGGLSHWGLPA